ncbi:DedA family protein [Serinicoccus hydrothermalis]|uniref:DedA family protein n=1 Tax=Serinicoccus hydrothermalis TaxID=1758689 RepID=UPI0009F30981|nr:VTT domain-containing protein [Serinicoccus hydrothermalis]
MPDLDAYPFVGALAFLFLVALLRGQVTYAVARLVTEQALRHTRPTSGWTAAVHRWLDGEAVGRGRAVVQRWGMVAVALCYLTVGLQTLVLAGAGAIRMPWGRFTLAQVPGALAWATIYATVGFAVWAAVVGAVVSGHPLLVALVAVLLLGAAVAGHLLLRRRCLALDDAEDVVGRVEALQHLGVDEEGRGRRDTE